MEFYREKRKNCDPEDPNDENMGDNWDHIAFDPENRLIICVIPGKRTTENTIKLVFEFKTRTGGRIMRLITTYKYMPYVEAIFAEYSEIINPYFNWQTWSAEEIFSSTKTRANLCDGKKTS